MTNETLITILTAFGVVMSMVAIVSLMLWDEAKYKARAHKIASDVRNRQTSKCFDAMCDECQAKYLEQISEELFINE